MAIKKLKWPIKKEHIRNFSCKFTYNEKENSYFVEAGASYLSKRYTIEQTNKWKDKVTLKKYKKYIELWKTEQRYLLLKAIVQFVNDCVLTFPQKIQVAAGVKVELSEDQKPYTPNSAPYVSGYTTAQMKQLWKNSHKYP